MEKPGHGRLRPLVRFARTGGTGRIRDVGMGPGGVGARSVRPIRATSPWPDTPCESSFLRPQAIGALTGDGQLDALRSDFSEPPNLFATTEGRLLEPFPMRGFTPEPGQMWIADVTGDGLGDVVSVAWGEGVKGRRCRGMIGVFRMYSMRSDTPQSAAL